MDNLNCTNCIHYEVCYLRNIVNAAYANKCGYYLEDIPKGTENNPN